MNWPGENGKVGDRDVEREKRSRQALFSTRRRCWCRPSSHQPSSGIGRRNSLANISISMPVRLKKTAAAAAASHLPRWPPERHATQRRPPLLIALSDARHCTLFILSLARSTFSCGNWRPGRLRSAARTKHNPTPRQRALKLGPSLLTRRPAAPEGLQLFSVPLDLVRIHTDTHHHHHTHTHRTHTDTQNPRVSPTSEQASPAENENRGAQGQHFDRPSLDIKPPTRGA